MAGRESGYGRQLGVAAAVCDTSILVSQTDVHYQLGTWCKPREPRPRVLVPGGGADLPLGARGDPPS
eukprot:SAG25_NODE_8_length_29132_cov_108.213895_21_plen_67_part_00